MTFNLMDLWMATMAMASIMWILEMEVFMSINIDVDLMIAMQAYLQLIVFLAV